MVVAVDDVVIAGSAVPGLNLDSAGRIFLLFLSVVRLRKFLFFLKLNGNRRGAEKFGRADEVCFVSAIVVGSCVVASSSSDSSSTVVAVCAAVVVPAVVAVDSVRIPSLFLLPKSELNRLFLGLLNGLIFSGCTLVVCTVSIVMGDDGVADVVAWLLSTAVVVLFWSATVEVLPRRLGATKLLGFGRNGKSSEPTLPPLMGKLGNVRFSPLLPDSNVVALVVVSSPSSPMTILFDSVEVTKTSSFGD